MKKQFFILGCLIYLPQAIAQTVIPQTIPCITITQSNVVGLGSGITATDCIDTDGNLTFLQYENYSIKAGEYISFGQNTSINPDAAHQFHAYIDNGGMEIGWYYPNETPGTVGQYEKLELGVEFRDDIDQLVQNFTAETQVAPNLNPFNPEQIDLYAEFWWYSDGSNPFFPAGWFGPQKINGFYYEEYVRPSSDTDPYPFIPSQHDFRIRFAPRILGLWRCKITAVVEGFGTFTASEFTFNCVDSDSKDFMAVGENGRYFKTGNEPFFPVGHNLVWPQGSSTEEWERSFNDIIPPSYFVSYQQQMSEIVANGGNYMRFINNPWSTDCEFEELNDYSDRMRHSWEMDEILEHADSLDLRIHFNLQIHYNFGVPDVYGINHWDWPKYGDQYNDGDCAVENDSGYCYRRQLGLLDPIDFFTDPEAKKFYKYKLRYLIARYGYSNEIALFELFSEINGAGVINNMQLTTCYNDAGQPVDCCLNEGGDFTGEPYDSIATVPGIFYAWQHEMAQYIKDSLHHQDHPIAVSYGGEPDMARGDLSFTSQYIDIVTYNHYQVLMDKHVNAIAQFGEYFYNPAVNKPFMFSEYGGGDQYECDQGVDFIKTLVLSPFSGIAGCAMNWDWQSTDETFLWHHMGPVNDLMSGIKLDEEFWIEGAPIVSSNKAVEVLYLRNFVENNYRVVGAVSNRTYNYYTQGTGSPCYDLIPGGEIDNDEIYQNMTAYISTVGTQVLVIPDMGDEIEYKINWYNALTGEPIGTVSEMSLENGWLPLHFPFLSGNASKPILFFEIYRSDQPTFKLGVNDVSSNNDKLIQSLLNNDTTPSIIVLTQWDSLDDSTDSEELNSIILSPNPFNEFINVQCADAYLGVEWQLRNANGDIVKSGQVSSHYFTIDLSVYANGLYYIYFMTKTNAYVEKIIKQ
jgi:hypothetical protein